MTAYYNEIDPYAAQWLRNLIAGGHIANGDVDERSIADVKADELRGHTQCHFFAGIGGWSIALRLAGWPDDRPVWTGSCPCQPFSAAGAGKAFSDERHLWPAWFSLISECRPPVVFGEQVEAAVGWGWLDAVFSDLEGAGYACGAAVLPACSVGAPHIRNRLWFVADSDTSRRPLTRQHDGRSSLQATRSAEHGRTGSMAGSDGRDTSSERKQRGWEQRQQPEDSCSGGMEVTRGTKRRSWRTERLGESSRGSHSESSGPGDVGDLGDAAGGRQREQRDALVSWCGGHTDRSGVLNGFWHDGEWIWCTDGKARPVGPGSFPLGHGIQRRASKLRAYGNAIVPQVAAHFVAACMN